MATIILFVAVVMLAACGKQGAAGGNGAPGAERVELKVSAAVSLKGVLEKAKGELESAAGVTLVFNYGGSGTLAGQISQGAPVDLFISADQATVEKLMDAKTVESPVVVAGNTLVLVQRKDAAVALKRLEDVENAKRVAIGEPKVVPAGEYARQALVALKLWEPLSAAGKLVTAEDVAHVLTLVDRGEVDAGFVYRTDAMSTGNLREVAAVDASLHKPIEYVSAIVSAGRHKGEAAKLQDALRGKAFGEALKEYGFFAPGGEGRGEGMSWAYFHPWVLSLWVAAVATLINALVAIPLSYLMARRKFAGRWLVESLIILPLVLPPTVVGYLLMYLLGNRGLYGAITGETMLFTISAAVCASSVVSFPLLVLPTRAAFAATAREYDEEGRMAGLSAWQRFVHIAVPLARGGILSGLLLAFARALGEFGATLMLVGTSERTRTLPIQIYMDAGSASDFAAAWPAVLALGVTSVGVIVMANRLRWLERE